MTWRCYFIVILFVVLFVIFLLFMYLFICLLVYLFVYLFIHLCGGAIAGPEEAQGRRVRWREAAGAGA